MQSLICVFVHRVSEEGQEQILDDDDDDDHTWKYVCFPVIFKPPLWAQNYVNICVK